MYNVQTIDARIYNGASEQGSTKPYIMVCGPDREEYYVKLYGAKKGSKRYCIKELICGLLAKELEIEIPDFALINVVREIGEGVSDPVAQSDIANSEGLNFGSKLLRAAAYSYSMAKSLANYGRLHDIIAFDSYVLNEDRNADNPNMIVSEEGILYVIDHGFTLPFFMGDDIFLSMKSADDLAQEPFDKISKHALLEFGKKRRKKFDTILDKVNGIEDAKIEDMCDIIPEEWFDRATDRDKLQNFLIKRKSDRAILSGILEAGLNG